MARPITKHELHVALANSVTAIASAINECTHESDKTYLRESLEDSIEEWLKLDRELYPEKYNNKEN